MVQPLSEVTLVRPWHWGIAIVADPEGVSADDVGEGGLDEVWVDLVPVVE